MASFAKQSLSNRAQNVLIYTSYDYNKSFKLAQLFLQEAQSGLYPSNEVEILYNIANELNHQRNAIILSSNLHNLSVLNTSTSNTLITELANYVG